ncbi:MAG: LysR family transcriptional regulator [Candidatus Eisenbacteria bacterium]|uniref:LysR family transcriptional regulator n=1 Tax=Eiseniibacteriota bacterium TaxID=2212470 RepID=A0A956M359_UNCEI|nr:LysR family transcriptional regulator [Candidatus Eisenbacteria bacterium]
MMDWIDLETFVLAVQHGSLSEAARRLFVSQPAVSVRLRRLEAAVGEPLLYRSGRGVRPTPTGAHLFERARPLLDELRDLEKDLRGGGPLRGRLGIGCTDLVAVHHLPAVLRSLRRRHSQLEITVQVEGTAPLLSMLDANDVEVVLATLPVPEDRYASVPVFHDPLVVVAPPKHPLVGRKSVPPGEVAAEPWILHKPSSVSRAMVDGFFSSHGVRPRTEMEISSPEAIRELVHAGLGLSVLPERTVRRDLSHRRMGRVAVGGFALSRSSGWVVRRDRPLSRAAQALQEIVVERAAATRPG